VAKQPQFLLNPQKESQFTAKPVSHNTGKNSEACPAQNGTLI
jgi:hypothetical protein